jgi:phage tail sheath protein FI
LTAAGSTAYAVQRYFDSGGQKAIVVRVRSSSSVDTAAKKILGNDVAKTGIHALRKTEIFNLLCIPPVSIAAKRGGAPAYVTDVPIAVWSAAATLCRELRAFLIVDAPADWTVSSAIADIGLFAEIERSFSAIYFPRLRLADALQPGGSRDFAPSGSVAGVIARMDLTRGVWKAPAGSEAALPAAPGSTPRTLALNVNESEAESLASVGVNCLRTLPNLGTVIWGARTIDGADDRGSEWKYIPVRRLALYIEESVERGTQWAVFEPNNEALWGRIKSSVDAFLHGLFLAGAFRGVTPRAAYFTKCGRDTMTQADIDAGRMIVEIGMAPVRPAEFVIIRISLSSQKP